MDGEEGEGLRLSKHISDKNASGEVDYKTKSGTAWSHSFLNQKPWHPLSYPNQRRKWIAEQLHAQRERRAEEISREYAQEQEFFRQTALISKKEKEKVEMMKAVSFMYVRPPGYNAESAKAAEIADEQKRQEPSNPSHDEPSSSKATESVGASQPAEEKKKPRPKDVFGRSLPTEEEFEILKNAPRLDTGLPARSKPFGVEVRNVKCARCGTYGHQSGDRECPLKDVIMPNEESRLKRDDPLNAILAQTDLSEPLKWELKQRPGMSPPRGGFDPDDPNQQIVAEDIFDEYGGFLGGESINIPDVLTKFSTSKQKKKKSSKKMKAFDNDRKKREKEEMKRKKKRQTDSESISSDDSLDKMKHGKGKSRGRQSHSSKDSDSDRHEKEEKKRKKKQQTDSESTSDDSEPKMRRPKGRRSRSRSRRRSHSPEESELNRYHGAQRNRKRDANSRWEEDEHERRGHSKKNKTRHYYPSSSEDDRERHRSHRHWRRITDGSHHRRSEDSNSDDNQRKRGRHHHRQHHQG
ncbi:hypothetical protein SAY86_012281 [Trapa natans]|uniref:CBF1-interacting co-repressor CIR N-terminal domain-containing protein n=1 Tax=Trapa natans TaxID=22666 RepID=A0AAN7M9S0_TRANT|nr:hypothetical protein SAY86_012281 [Trapa natans]